MTQIYTRTGDQGETGLLGGSRRPKNDPRIEACGCVDELNACLGRARADGAPAPLCDHLLQVQHLLFELGADLATPAGRPPRAPGIMLRDVEDLEKLIDTAEASLPASQSFVLPGGTSAAAALHVARTVCRRAERACVTLRQLEPDSPNTSVAFLNRLSDLLFVWARLANSLAGEAETYWRGRHPA